MSDALPSRERSGKRRVMITGAHRRVAIAFIARLLDDPNVEMILAVSHGACPSELMGHDPARFHYTSADLSRRRQVDNLFLLEQFRDRPLDTVVHLAFQGNPVGYDFRRHEFNVRSTQWLLEGSINHGVDKYIFLSSDAVYKIGPRNDYKVREDAELNLDPGGHPIVRDTIDAEFLCRAKMDDPRCEIMVMRPSGVLGGGVMSGINLLFESDPPLLPVGFDPMINPTTKARLARDLHLAVRFCGKGVYNVSGPAAGPISHFLEEAGLHPKHVPGPTLRLASRVQRIAGRSRYRAGFHPKRLYYSLVLDDRRFEESFRAQARDEDPGPETSGRNWKGSEFR